ncbi:LysR family transcriptional regulator [Pantoea sp. Eser]|nr:LysR family transcriptional regulator [Pantoea sp. Eser]
MTADKNALEVFVIVAQTRNFRLAAEQLGVTRSAISQTLRRLEDRLNLSLMQRTTRTIQLTEAGQRLYAEVAPAINQLNRAITDIAELAAEQGREFDVAVNPQLTTNDMGVMIRTACAGGGISFGTEETFQPYIVRGELVTVLDAWLPTFAGFYLYFPSRKNFAPKLRALIDHVKL